MGEIVSESLYLNLILLGFSNTNFGLAGVVLNVLPLLNPSNLRSASFVVVDLALAELLLFKLGMASGDLDALKIIECIAWSLVTTQFKFVGFKDTSLRVFS